MLIALRLGSRPLRRILSVFRRPARGGIESVGILDVAMQAGMREVRAARHRAERARDELGMQAPVVGGAEDIAREDRSKTRRSMRPGRMASLARTARKSATSSTKSPRRERKCDRAVSAAGRPRPAKPSLPRVSTPNAMRTFASSRTATSGSASRMIESDEKKSW